MSKYIITSVTLLNGLTIEAGTETPKARKIEIVDGVAYVTMSTGTVIGYRAWAHCTAVPGSADIASMVPASPAPTPASKRR